MVERRKAVLTQYQEVLQCAACMLHQHTVFLHLGRQTVTVLTPILLMWFLVFSNTAAGDRRQRDSLDPLCDAHTPPVAWSTGFCRGCCRQVPQVRSPDTVIQPALLPGQAGCTPTACLSVCSLLSIPSRVLAENGYSLALYFLQKTLVTFLSQNKRIPNSTQHTECE